MRKLQKVKPVFDTVPEEIVRSPVTISNWGLHAKEPYRPRVVKTQRYKNRNRSFSPSLALFLLAIVAVVSYWLIQRPVSIAQKLVEQSTITAALSLPLPFPTGEVQNKISHVIKPKDDLSSITTRYGFNKRIIPQLEKSFQALNKDGGVQLRPNDKVQLVFDDNGVIKSLHLTLAKNKNVIFNKDETGFSPELLPDDGESFERVVLGEVQSSFSAAANKAGISYETIDEMVDLFGSRFEFSKDFQPGDRFTIIFRRSPTKKKDEILVAAFTVNGQTHIATRYVGNDGKARYFDENGKVFGGSYLRYPLQFTRITSYVTDSRFHPVLKRNRPHNGVDFAAPVGTPVRSVADGYVMFAGYKGPNGNMVQIRHSDRYTTAYLHLSKIASGVTRGKFIHKGELIGAVGSTGLSSGPHLHYSMFDNGRYINPLTAKLPYEEKLPAGKRIDKKYLEKVLFTIENYQKIDLKKREAGRNVS